MMPQFSARTKAILYVIICLLVFYFLIFIFLIPGIHKLESISAELKTAQTQESDTKNAIANFQSNNAVLDQVASEATSYTGVYYAPMKPEEADTLISGMVSRYSFVPISLTIDPLKKATVRPYAPSGLLAAAVESLPEKAVAASEDEGNTKGRAQELQSYRVSVTATSTTNQVAAIIGEICNNPSLHLISYDVQMLIAEENVYSETGDITSTQTETTYELTLVLELFTYDAHVRASGGGTPENRNRELEQDLPGGDIVNDGAIGVEGENDNTDTEEENGATGTEGDNSGTGTEEENNGSSQSPDNAVMF